jgi:hypothetical protein
MITNSGGILVTREMIELEDEVWDDPVDILFVSQPQKGVPEDALTSSVCA